MTSQSPPPPNKHTLDRVLRSPYRLHAAVVGALLFALVLTAIVLPVAQAIPLHALTLALIQSADYAYYTPYPYMTGGLNLSKEYVPPREWNGSQFVPAIVNITASASDQDTYNIEVNGVKWFFFVPDAVTGDITGPAAYTDVNPWFGVSATGEFSTANYGGQSVARITETIKFDADDAAPNLGQDDDAVHYEEDIHVVLPNAATTTWIDHFESPPCIGDEYRHQAFHLPDTVSQQSPAPTVSFNNYTVQEGDWRLISVDASGGLDYNQVQQWFNNRHTNWIGTHKLDSQNEFPDNNSINRALTASTYSSFNMPGVIRLRQGWRTINPNTSPWWYHDIEYHFIDEAYAHYPGKCYTRKQSYSKISSSLTWVQCPNLN